MDKRETAVILGILAAAFPYVTVSMETATVYHDALLDLPPDVALRTVRDLVKTEERFPSPAVIRRNVFASMGQLAPTASQALTEVVEQVTACGMRTQPSFSHGAVQRTVNAIGWYAVCMSTNPEAFRAHFMKLYELEQNQADLVLIRSERKELEA